MRYSLLRGVRDGGTVVGGGQVRLRHRCALGDGDWRPSIGQGGDGHFCPPPAENFGAALQGGQISRTRLHTRTVTIMKHAHYSGGEHSARHTRIFIPVGAMRAMCAV